VFLLKRDKIILTPKGKGRGISGEIPASVADKKIGDAGHERGPYPMSHGWGRMKDWEKMPKREKGIP